MIGKRVLSRIIIVALTGVLALLSPSAGAQDRRMPTASQTKPHPSDPVPGAGVYYPPSVATGDTAYNGAPKFVPQVDCTPEHPCAATSSAPKQGEHR